VGRSRMFIARTRALNAPPNALSLSRMRYLGAVSQGNASVIWRASHSAVGFWVTANHNSSRRRSIDPEPYQIAVDQAEARLGSAGLQIDALEATYRQQLAELQSAKDSADFDEREYARKKALVASGWTPRAVYERAERDLKVARQHIASIDRVRGLIFLTTRARPSA
jgi:hypothetical protein